MKLPNFVLVQRLVLSCSWLVSDENALWIHKTLRSRYPFSFPAPSPPGCVHLRGQKLPREKVSLQQFATSFQPRLCNPITEQISLVEHQKRKKRGKKKKRRALGRCLGRSGGETHFPKGEGRLGTSNRTGPWTVYIGCLPSTSVRRAQKVKPWLTC